MAGNNVMDIMLQIARESTMMANGVADCLGIL
jgi:hypothetical protein